MVDDREAGTADRNSTVALLRRILSFRKMSFYESVLQKLSARWIIRRSITPMCDHDSSSSLYSSSSRYPQERAWLSHDCVSIASPRAWFTLLMNAGRYRRRAQASARSPVTAREDRRIWSVKRVLLLLRELLRSFENCFAVPVRHPTDLKISIFGIIVVGKSTEKAGSERHIGLLIHNVEP